MFTSGDKLILVNIEDIGRRTLEHLRLYQVCTYIKNDTLNGIYIEEYHNALFASRFIRYSPVIAELYDLQA